MAKSISSRNVIKKLEADGWVLSRINGDHHHFKHPSNPALITVTHPVKDLPIGTLRNIFRTAGWEWPR